MRGSSLACLALLLAIGLLGGAAGAPESPDEKLLRENKVPTDGPGLLAFLRQRFTPISQTRAKELIEQLGDDSFAKREEASRQLVLHGARVKKVLQAALAHEDLEVRSRAQACLRAIENDALAANVVNAGIRVLAQRKPPGAARLLLDQLPNLADEPAIAEEVRQALVALATRDGKAEPVLVAALASKVPLERMTAAVSLARARALDQLPALRKLLDDPDEEVKQDVALALVPLGVRDAIPVLIASLSQPISPRYGEVEEILIRLAGEKSPSLTDEDVAARKKYRAQWEAWWKENGARVDLGILKDHALPLGRTLVVLLDARQILSLDADNKVRWKIDGLEMVLDVQPLPGDRVLLAEYKNNRVTERNSKGEILWEKKINEPLMAQRLPNGHTLIASREGIVEIDRKDREVFSYNAPGGQFIMRAQKLPGGDIVLVTQLGGTRFIRLNRFGKQVRTFGVEVQTSGGRLGVTATGHVLVPEMNNDRILEYDAEGKLVREIPARQPIAAIGLRGGRVLYTSMTEKRAVEIDRAGKEVWEYRRDTRVSRAVRY